MAFGPQDVGRGYLAVLTIFTILEFFIAVIATHFGCQAARAQAHAVSASPLPTPTRGHCAAMSSPFLHPGTQRSFRGKVGLFSSWPQGGASTKGPVALCAWTQSLGRQAQGTRGSVVQG